MVTDEAPPDQWEHHKDVTGVLVPAAGWGGIIPTLAPDPQSRISCVPLECPIPLSKNPGSRKAVESPGSWEWFPMRVGGDGEWRAQERPQNPGIFVPEGLGRALLECVGRTPENPLGAEPSLGCFPSSISTFQDVPAGWIQPQIHSQEG